MLAEPSSPRRARSFNWRSLAETALVLAVFALNSGWPVPDVNEPHYLGKAKHFWDPTWGEGHLFLESADAHTVFYATFGWLSLLMPLECFAWTMRLITWTLMAVAWQRLSFAVVPRRWWSVLSAALFVLFNERLHMAGEWVVGGAEAKGLSYALVFFALERLVRGRWQWVWPLLGLATSFHVLVGGWSLLAAGLVWIFDRRDRPLLAQTLGWLLVGLLLAAPGLWFAIQLNAGVDPSIVSEAEQLQAFTRLHHHLSPLQFREGNVPRHLLLWGTWFVLCTVTTASAGQLRLRWFVAASMLFAVIGFVIALATQHSPDLAAPLLRYYWFRLADVIVPLGLAIESLSFVAQLELRDIRRAHWWLVGLMIVASAHLVSRAISITTIHAPRSDGLLADYQSWRQLCDWAANNTSPDSRFLTPRHGYTFKWYSGRNDVLSWKDIPQDAPGVIKWWQWMQDIHGTGNQPPADQWYASLGEHAAEKLRDLGRKYQADYVVVVRTHELAPLALPEVYSNSAYVVYLLNDATYEK